MDQGPRRSDPPAPDFRCRRYALGKQHLLRTGVRSVLRIPESLDAHDPDEIRSILDTIEIENNKIHGYGAVNFGRNLSQCYLHLAERAVDEHDLKRVTAFAHEILSREIEFMPGVEETLPFLAENMS
jgi:hypothetical protein